MGFQHPVGVLPLQDQDTHRADVDTTNRDVVDLATLDDGVLLTLMIHGEDAALGVLYDRYHRAIFAIALRVTGDQEKAEEVLQDVFHSVWTTASSFQYSKDFFFIWLITTTRRQAIDATRNHSPQARNGENSFLVDPPNSEESGIEHEVDVLVLRETACSALNELPTIQRRAIELAFYEGMTRTKIAECLNESLNTVKTCMRLGMLRLCVLLGSVRVLQ